MTLRLVCILVLPALVGCQQAKDPVQEGEPLPISPSAEPISTEDYELRLRGVDRAGLSAFHLGIASLTLKIDGQSVPLQPEATWMELAASTEPTLIAKIPWRGGDEHTYAFELRFDEYGAMEKNGSGSDFHASLQPLRWLAEKSGLEENRRVTVDLELNGSVVTTATGEAWLMPHATVSY